MTQNAKVSLQGLVDAAQNNAFEYVWNSPEITASREILDALECDPSKHAHLKDLYRNTVHAYARGLLTQRLVQEQHNFLKCIRIAPRGDKSYLSRINQQYATKTHEARSSLAPLNQYLERLVHEMPFFLDEAEAQRTEVICAQQQAYCPISSPIFFR